MRGRAQDESRTTATEYLIAVRDGGGRRRHLPALGSVLASTVVYSRKGMKIRCRHAPERLRPVVMLPIGHAAEEPRRTSRRGFDYLVWHERF